ncbi:hypothetical protein QBC47DRAFT_416364 [Echria macrotheca]|uniref:C2H2-type domain-containing protein n=1 Tax=Echria macrotheca TaxID=438768 RepID=A0AAJ0F936_9PEZI|nr:hypothetical protein QBC47DRAFT_416364 [Echria macrotheca]
MKGPSLIHTEPVARRFKCEFESCLRSFSTRMKLEWHSWYTHSKKAPFACLEPDSGRGFSPKSDIACHIQSYRANPNQCELCKVYFAQPIALAKHQMARCYATDEQNADPPNLHNRAGDYRFQHRQATKQDLKLNYQPSLLGVQSWEVPGTINGVPVHALPDSGSSVDAISEEFARKHCLEVEPANKLRIPLPGGRHAESYGRVVGRFQFHGENQVYKRCFRVLRKSVYDVVLGRSFLDLTRTLTSFTHRIISRMRPCIRDGSRLFLLDEAPRDRLRCTVNGVETAAFPDTGSDLMLVSGDFARRNNFKVHRESRYRRDVQLIDGSIVRTEGMVLGADLSFDGSSLSSAGEVDYYDFLEHSRGLSALTGSKTSGSSGRLGSTTFICDLHVIENLPCDIILSNEFIFKNRVFSRFKHLFFSGPPTPTPLLHAGNFTYPKPSTAGGRITIEGGLLFMRLKRTKKSWFTRRPQLSTQSAESEKAGIPLEQQATNEPSWQELWEMEERRRNDMQLWISSLDEPRRSEERMAESRRREDWDRTHPRVPNPAAQTSVVSPPALHTPSGP